MSVQLDEPTESTTELIKAAFEVLKQLYKSGYHYKKAGVLLTRLEPRQTIQYGLFEQRDHTKSHALMKAIDSINQKHGTNTVKVLGEGIQQPWTLNANYRSRRATTHWDELVEI